MAEDRSEEKWPLGQRMLQVWELGKKEGIISPTVVKDYSLGIVTEIWIGRSQKSGGDLEMVGGGSELK